MRTRKFIIIAVFIVLVVINYNNFFGGYKNIEDAVRKNDNYEKTLEVFWINKSPLAFYLTDKNGISLVHLLTKERNGLLLYKTTYKESFGLNYPYSVLTYNTLDINDKNPNSSAERILYGVTVKNDINKLKLNGLDTKTVIFNKDGTEYCLWYIVGDNKLDEYANKKLF